MNNRAKTIKVLALRERFEHMSAVSGYDALYAHFSPELTADSVFCNFKQRYPRGIGRILENMARSAKASSSYNAHSVASEAKLLIKAALHKYNVVHYCYGEPYWGFGGRLSKQFKAPIVVTNHQPESWWQNNTHLFEKYKQTNAVITLSAHDEAYFNSHLPGKAVCIPHGVDVEFYHPASKAKDNGPFTIIFSGRYLRDMPVLCEAVKKLCSMPLDIRFNIVYPLPNDVLLKEIAAYKNVKWHTAISEQELLMLYQNAHCCLIPLQDCTANNAILEAMACGLPVISTQLPPIKTYLESEMAILGRKGNAQDLVEAVLQLYNNRELLKKMAVAAREKAVKHFDWNIIASRTLELFKRCHD